MKAKAPEKIYLQVCGDCNANECENCKFEELEDNVTWCKDKIFEKDILYIRADSVTEWIKERIEEIDKFGTYLSPKGVLTNLLCRLDTLEAKEMYSEKEINT